MSRARVARGIALAALAAWSTQSCKTPNEGFDCSSDDQCDLGEGKCDQGVCKYRDDSCPEKWRSRGQCTTAPSTSGSGGTSGNGGSGTGSTPGSGGGNGSGGDGPGAGGDSGNGGTSAGGSNAGGGSASGGSGSGGLPADPDGGSTGENHLEVVAGVIGGKGSIDGRGPLARLGTPGCLAYDGARYFYVGDDFSGTIRRVDATTGDVTTIAGFPDASGFLDGTGSEARFDRPECVAYDGLDAQNPVLYVAEWDGDRIRKIDLKTNGVTLLAGSPDGEPGLVDATGTNARFHAPEAMVRKGPMLLVADAYNNAIRAVNVSTGAVTTLAGDAAAGAEGDDDGPPLTARFKQPHALALDATGNRLFIGELTGRRIRVLNFGMNTVSTLVSNTGNIGSLAYDTAGNRLFASAVADDKVLLVNLTATPATFSTIGGGAGHDEVDGTPPTAAFRAPHGLAVTAANTLFVADYEGPTIRRLVEGTNKVWRTSTFAGLPRRQALKDGAFEQARFNDHRDLELAPDGQTLYIADTGNCAIRQLNLTTNAVSTVAGGASCDSANGTGAAARFSYPGPITLGVPATTGAAPPLFVAEKRGVVRRVDTATRAVSTLNTALADEELVWHGIAATATTVYVTDEWNRKVFQVPVAGGPLTDFAGSGADGCADTALASSSFGRLGGVIWDGGAYLYVTDLGCLTVRRIAIAGDRVETVAGGGSGDLDGIGTAARFNFPASLQWDREKQGFYVQDGHSVRWVNATTFEVKTIVGDPSPYGGVWLPPNPARLNEPKGLVEPPNGGLYIATEQAILRWNGP